MDAQAADAPPRPDDPALIALCRRHRVRRLDLFGSAATGAFDPERSDLDFLVEFEALEPGTYFDAYFGLREGLESVVRPRGRSRRPVGGEEHLLPQAGHGGTAPAVRSRLTAGEALPLARP
jgi:hypothetical protein